LQYFLPLRPIVNKWNKINTNILPVTDSTAIVPFNGKLDSTIGYPRFTKFIRDLTYLNTDSLDVLVGLFIR